VVSLLIVNDMLIFCGIEQYFKAEDANGRLCDKARDFELTYSFLELVLLHHSCLFSTSWILLRREQVGLLSNYETP
jgi:hypothetical protein